MLTIIIITCKLCRGFTDSIFTTEVEAWMKSPGRSQSDRELIVLALLQELPVWSRAATRTYQHDGRFEPIRVYKDSELQVGECMQICQRQSHRPGPRHDETIEPLAMLLGVNVRIGNDHFTCRFREMCGQDSPSLDFTAPPRFQKVRVIGQGGFGKCGSARCASGRLTDKRNAYVYMRVGHKLQLSVRTCKASDLTGRQACANVYVNRAAYGKH